MTRFAFDATAALQRARQCENIANRPNLPNRDPEADPGLGRLGRLGPIAPETTQATDPDRLAVALDHFEERAAIRQFDSGQSRAEAEAAALAEAARAWGVDPEHILKIATEKD